MVIERQLKKLVVFADETVREALQRIDQNQNRIVFAVAESGILQGVLSDGDFRRWAAKQEAIDLQQSVGGIINREFRFAYVDDPPERIRSLLSPRIQYVPLVDQNRRLVAVARERGKYDGLRIGDHTIDEDSPVFVIAEIGINHNGDADLARRLVDHAADAGADCAKFQMRNLESLYRGGDIVNEDLGAQYTIDLLTRYQLSSDEMCRIFDHCVARGITPLCTPWDVESLELLERYGMAGYKVASADLTNHPLLAEMAKTGKPLICSTGMSTEVEIIESVRLLQHYGSSYILLHCNSTYPTPFKDVNLKYLDHLRELGNCPVGYSGHERGYSIPVACVARGAKVIEKHLTVDRGMEGNDHKVSLLPEEFRGMVEAIRQVEEAMGSASERRLSQGELMNRVTLAKSVVVTRNLEPGELIAREFLEVKSPGRGLQPNRLPELVGKRARRPMKAGDFFFPSDLVEDIVQPRPYTFRRPWGVAVRYHDFRGILAKSNPDFLEFHLSYKDLDVDHRPYFDREYEMDLVVHSPDLFPGDHLLNLCDRDEGKRIRSVRELQRVIDLTRKLKPFFTRCRVPRIVASLGGYTVDGHLPKSERPELYALIARSLKELDSEGVEILPQTLPPFPWYFGGQLYLNLFVDADDTAEFCEQYDMRLTLDISHSKLACNTYHTSFSQLVDRLAPLTSHLHISDAEGLDGEGLQILEGEVDFADLAERLDRLAPGASFIPEIWQGHKNEGEGFWAALERLEKYL